ncbi:MAG: hypothetical protein K2I54_04995 [Muribaculaceae bacterium]|nr:hypothetical protein [Muribaculaceae bacterium]
MTEIFEIEDLGRLREYLSGFADIDKLRTELHAGFLRYAAYVNASEWNRAIRHCECLAIVGWGDHEALEAIKGSYFNGNPNTFFVNRNSEPRFLDAVWSARQGGVAIDFGLSTFHDSHDSVLSRTIPSGIGEIQTQKLNSQRNWIPKNPICITRGLANCYENSRALIDSMENELKPELNRRMRPELYGNAINRIILNCSFSFYDNYHCKTNYIIADESLKLKQKDFYPELLKMYSPEEIEANGYYLRNRFSYGPFNTATGQTRVAIVFEKEFSDQLLQKQKQLLAAFLIHAVERIAGRLSKKIDYNFSLMIADFSTVLQEWSGV